MPINNLRCCGSVYPRVVGEHPVFTFQAHDFIPKTMQVSVFHEQELSTPLWQSEVLSADTFSITCNATLQERSRYAWRVRATDKAGRCETSGLAYFETGFFGDAMPGAQWVGSGQESSAPILFDRFSYSGQEPPVLQCFRVRPLVCKRPVGFVRRTISGLVGLPRPQFKQLALSYPRQVPLLPLLPML